MAPEPPLYAAQDGPYRTLPGRPLPLGPTVDGEGVNFSIYCGQATGVELLLFDRHDSADPFQVITLQPELNCTFMFWHVYVLGLEPGYHYAYRVDGPHDVYGQGQRYNRNKVLIDPYARGISISLWNRAAACGPDDNLATALHGMVINTSGYDWEGDMPLRLPMTNTVIYELHVGGFTRSPSSGCRYPGTFAGVVEKIPYLKQLGITAVELMPVSAFDAQEGNSINPVDGRPLTNYWGYSSLGFFSPHPGYCISPDDATHLTEFRDMVKALHHAGIEVLLDVVFNHTSEGNEKGPTISLRGLDNAAYYYLDPQDRQGYLDYSGCGNTVSCNHPIVSKLILECLEFWAKEMHVDGFRFDEGSILSRGPDGKPMEYPPIIWSVELSDTLADVKVIAEAWDAAGLYQVGYFPGRRWAEWNGRYRDDVRRFVIGEPGLVGVVASRIAGSADIFQAGGELPMNSVNFITCHDGFTLNDLVSYNHKHNAANGEGNRDGADQSYSWNCGVEGPSGIQAVEALRERQIRNFLAILLLSRGVPMLLAGDEFRRTQQGNNNAYCQDNEMSWIDWSLLGTHSGLFRFCRLMIAFRKGHFNLHGGRFFTGQANERGHRDITWHGTTLNSPGWNDPTAQVLAFTLGSGVLDTEMHVMLNMSDTDLSFEIPALDTSPRNWYRAIDTALPSPRDIATPGEETLAPAHLYLVRSKSVVVLIAKQV